LRRKPAVKPAAKVKGIYWTKLPMKVVPTTVWKELDENERINFSALERFFPAQDAAPKKAAEKKGNPTFELKRACEMEM
jgi:hypothetical protein